MTGNDTYENCCYSSKRQILFTKVINYLNHQIFSLSFFLNLHALSSVCSLVMSLCSCDLLPFSNVFQYLLQAENSMTVRAYMGEVLTQVWLKSVKK